MRILLVVIWLVTLSGCATITRGTTEAYAIETTPSGATAKLSTGLTCKTPCSLKVKRRGDFTVTLEKEGFEVVNATVTSSIDGAGGAGMAGNVILGGIIGAGVDAGSGAMHSHKPNPLQVTLSRVGESQVDLASASNADTYDQLMKLDELRQRGVLSEEEFAAQKAILLGDNASVDINGEDIDSESDKQITDEKPVAGASEEDDIDVDVLSAR